MKQTNYVLIKSYFTARYKLIFESYLVLVESWSKDQSSKISLASETVIVATHLSTLQTQTNLLCDSGTHTSEWYLGMGADHGAGIMSAAVAVSEVKFIPACYKGQRVETVI